MTPRPPTPTIRKSPVKRKGGDDPAGRDGDIDYLRDRDARLIITKQETTMRTFEMRVYALRTKEALDFYVSTVYPRHLNNFGRFGVEAHGLWTQKNDVAHRVFVLVSYAEGNNPVEVAQRYIQSPEAAEDARGFDVADILSVDSTILIPSTSSPLK